jgi:hypothetical protein
MRLLITDLTRMRQERLCVAGLTEKYECVRLDVGYPGIQREHLFRDSQVLIRPRAVVNLEAVPNFQRKAPHFEDHHWLDPETTTLDYVLDDKRWYNILECTCFPGVHDVFETPLIDNKRAAAWQGTRSLGTVKAKVTDVEYGKDDYRESGIGCRLSFVDSGGAFFRMIPVVDLTSYLLYLRDKRNYRLDKLEAYLHHLLVNAEKIWLRVGLTRPWERNKGEELFSYLQVAGVFTSPDYLMGRCFADFITDDASS